MEFVPSESDLEWTRNLIGILRDNGMWGTSWGVYQLNKKDKVLALTVAVPFTSQENIDHNHNRTKIVFEKLGWTVVNRSEPEKEERP